MLFYSFFLSVSGILRPFATILVVNEKSNTSLKCSAWKSSLVSKAAIIWLSHSIRKLALMNLFFFARALIFYNISNKPCTKIQAKKIFDLFCLKFIQNSICFETFMKLHTNGMSKWLKKKTRDVTCFCLWDKTKKGINLNPIVLALKTVQNDWKIIYQSLIFIFLPEK